MTSAILSNRNIGIQSERTRQRHLSSNTVIRQGEQLINTLTLNRLRENDHVNDNVVLAPLETNLSRGNTPEYLREIGKAFKNAADEFDKNDEMQSIISKITPDMKDSILEKVAKNLLGGAQLSWGKILVFFYFAYKLCSKALQSIRQAIQFCAQFMRDNIVGWVIEHGGWEAFSWGANSAGQFFKSKPVQQACLLVGVVVGGYLVYRKIKATQFGATMTSTVYRLLDQLLTYPTSGSL